MHSSQFDVGRQLPIDFNISYQIEDATSLDIGKHFENPAQNMESQYQLKFEKNEPESVFKEYLPYQRQYQQLQTLSTMN